MNDKMWTIKPQVIKDYVLGMTMEFAVADDGTMRLYIYPDDHEIGLVGVGCCRDTKFDIEGNVGGGGTGLRRCHVPKPTADLSGTTVDDILGEHGEKQ